MAVACDENDCGKCDIPTLGAGLTYTQISAGAHTVLLRSDGSALACGENDSGNCDIPVLEDNLVYAPCWVGEPDLIVQLSIEASEATLHVVCRSSFSGEQLVSLVVPEEEQRL